MRPARILAAAALVAANTLAPSAVLAQSTAPAQPPGIKRTDVLRSDFSVPGREVIQVLVEIAPGVAFPEHSHPGEEVAYVVKGSLEYALEGRPPVTLEAGDALFIPAGVPHAVKNVGSGEAAELATYIVEKGRPLLVLSQASAAAN
jgi:quercetin dioxygenase-like cupin family protein